MKKVLLCIFSLCCAGKAEAHVHTHHVHHEHVANVKKKEKKNKNMSSLKGGWKQNGVASFYGPGFWGHKTSSGKRMARNDMTAAHLSLPLGTVVKVTNKDNGKSVVVVINDRGPYVGHRILDLAERPAKILDMEGHGIAHVSIEKISTPVEVASYEERKNFHKKYKGDIQ